MNCPKCAPICKCVSTFDPEWRHEETCTWLQSRLLGMSVQIYQAETYKEWLRLGLKVFRLPPGFMLPPPWDLEKLHPRDAELDGRHPFYKAFVAVQLGTGQWQWQWNPMSQEEVEVRDREIKADQHHDIEP